MKRTHYCGAIRKEHMGQTATLCGWVQNRRDMGGVIFLDVKDREGVAQVVCNMQYLPPEDFHHAETLHMQSVIQVEGEIRHRDEETYNPRLATGEVELLAKRLVVLSEAQPLPYSMDEDAKVREELRLKYRYLDLRRPQLQKALRFRHQVQMAAEKYLNGDGFTCIETPMLCKSTPEGARDYLVPSRVHPGKFYALPQSPQIFKQLLMVGGMDKYYQVARCFRDEDLRADRQPEFTQVDMEMSFVEQEDIFQHSGDACSSSVFRDVMGREIWLCFSAPDVAGVHGSLRLRQAGLALRHGDPRRDGLGGGMRLLRFPARGGRGRQGARAQLQGLRGEIHPHNHRNAD